MNQKSEAMTATKPDPKALRSYGLIMGGIIIILFGLLLPWLFDRTFHAWPWIIGGTFVLLALAIPTLLSPIYKLWMRFGHIMGLINTHIILTVLFYIIVTPIGIIMRIRHDPMRRKMTDLSSYKITSHVRAPKDMEKPF